MKAFALFDDAALVAREHVSEPPTERISINNALGRTLGRPACAYVDMPPFDRSMMDGYAVRHEDTISNAIPLGIVDNIPAGHASAIEIGPLQAARCMTGAPVPQGADAIARFEWCTEENHSVRVLKPIRMGESVQRRGEDGRRGDLLVPSGIQLTGRHLSVLQSFGVDAVDVRVRPKATIIATGSELVTSVEQPLKAGQIYASNHWFLQDALEKDGYQVVSVRFVEDNPQLLEKALRAAIEESDVVLTTGGVSVGTHDYVREVTAQCGVDVAVENVWMRPGSPFVIGRKGNTAVFAMSGNPAACFVQFESLVRPALRAALGWAATPFTNTAILSHPVDLKPIKHVRILRGRTTLQNGTLSVHVQMAQSAGVIANLVDANCLVRLDVSDRPTGSLVPIQFL